NTEERIQEALKPIIQQSCPISLNWGREFDVPYLCINYAGKKALITWVECLNNLYTSPTPEVIEKVCQSPSKTAGSG
ncbi:hypothetical protein N7489_007806, partial [Penicillium chrysogenum]|uniref:uncharacterized protein n=1 Tax=Penicillium chrysogenum TaxID=5076 RepID=UPI0024DF2C84